MKRFLTRTGRVSQESPESSYPSPKVEPFPCNPIATRKRWCNAIRGVVAESRHDSKPSMCTYYIVSITLEQRQKKSIKLLRFFFTAILTNHPFFHANNHVRIVQALR